MHGDVAAPDDETALRHARFPSLLALSPKGERDEVSLHEFHANLNPGLKITERYNACFQNFHRGYSETMTIYLALCAFILTPAVDCRFRMMTHEQSY